MTEERLAHDPRFRSGPPARPSTALPVIPVGLTELLSGARVQQVWVKHESEVWRIDGPDGRAYLKIMDDLGPFADEVARLRWCEDHSPVATPHLLGDALDERGRGWFVASEVPGTPGHEPEVAGDTIELARVVAAGLRRFHDAADAANCPFLVPVDEFVASAEARVAGGGVEPSTMRTEAYRQQTAAQLLDHLIATRPDEPVADQVVTHGDPCQPNLLLRASADGLELSGVVDVGRLGVTDRFRDLAIAARSLDQNHGPEAASAFLAAYGPEADDPDRLTWWTLVDDLW